MSSKEQAVAPSEPFRFRLIHIFYAMAILGASLATCGVGGIFLAVGILAIWFNVFWGTPPPRANDGSKPASRSFSLVELLVVIAIIGVLVAILLPAVRSARGAASRSHCSNNLKQITLALHNYHDTFGSFPPAYIADENGKPMHSWRVLILPFLEKNNVYDQYRFDEPWDGPNNRKLLNSFTWIYQCPAHRLQSGETTTCYFAVVGPDTAWPGAEPRGLDDLPSVSDTFFLVEGPPRKIQWSEPRDLTVKEAAALFNNPFQDNGAHVYDANFRDGRRFRSLASTGAAAGHRRAPF
jgi:prepilin-type N-terminal cleavage/methylation domain-containing protein